MCSPVPQTHPAEVVLAVVALHVVTTSILLDTNITLGTVLGVRRYVVRCLRVVCTFREPSSDSFTI